MSNANVIEKIKNLLALAANAGTEAEAENASRHAQRLMTQYRIETAELELAAAEDNHVVAPIQENMGAESGGKIAQWKISLMTTIAKINGCSLLMNWHWDGYGQGVRRKKVHSFNIIGTEADAAMATAFYVSIRDTIEHLAKINKPKLGRGDGKNWATSFKLGCASTIRARLKEGHEEARAEALKASSCTALAVVDQREGQVSSWISEKYKKLGSRQASASRVNIDAYSAGRAAGSKVNLTTKVLGS